MLVTGNKVRVSFKDKKNRPEFTGKFWGMTFLSGGEIYLCFISETADVHVFVFDPRDIESIETVYEDPKTQGSAKLNCFN